MEPVDVFAVYSAAAASGDIATLEAANGAHPVAFPNIAAMLQANPSVKQEAAIQTRYRRRDPQD